MDKYYVAIGGKEIETINIFGRVKDADFADRASKAIKFAKREDLDPYALFVDSAEWKIIHRQIEEQPIINDAGEIQYNADGTVKTEEQILSEEWDNSDYCVAGTITDNRDGTVTCKMGKKTASDVLAELEAAYDAE